MIHNTARNFTLQDEHRDFLHRCAISDEIIDSRPYYSLTVESRVHLAERWHLSNEALRGDGIVLPRYTPEGEETYPQIRYMPPRMVVNELGEAKEQKYTGPVRSGGVIDVHPSALAQVRDASKPILFVESIKGSDALLSSGILAAGFHGVSGWKVNKAPSPMLARIPLAGRETGICFDADTVTRADLREVVKEFAGLLRFAGARVTIFDVPPNAGPETGIDDSMALLQAAGMGD